MQHDWIKSTLGHGNMMCRRCWATDLEAAALGLVECDAPPPKSANENVTREASQEEIDAACIFDDDEDGPEPGDECGRWGDGKLGRYCTKAGTEECDFECPYR